jgi:ABC-type nitrate/sulfonate/bicarbonate transport system permease component
MNSAVTLAERFRVPLCIVIVFGVWQTVHALAIVPEKFFPSIPAIFAAFWQMLANGSVLVA